MSRPASPTLPRILTIDRAYEPVADYLSARPWAADGPPPPSPLDVYLVHLTIEFSGRSAIVIDLTARSTCGASTVATLANPRVRQVIVEESRWPSTPAGERAHESAGRFIEAREPGRGRSLTIAGTPEEILDLAAAAAAPGDAIVALVPGSEFRGEGGGTAAAFLNRFPEGIAVVLGVERPGIDEAVEGLLRTAREISGAEARFLRDAAPSLFEATAALLARGATASDRSRRIADLFATNYDFLTVLRDSCLYAIERGARSTGDSTGRGPAPSAMFTSKSAFDDATHAHRALREENERLAHELREARAWVRKGNPMLIPVSKALSFGRRHRGWIAPAGSLRERAAHGMLRLGRKLRGG